MKTLFELEIERAAVHEAGHAIASVHLGVTFDHVEMALDGTGGVYPPKEMDIAPSELNSLARNQVIVAYAGAATQRLFFPDQPEHEIRQCSEDDYQKIKAISADFSGVEIGKQAEASANAIVERFRNPFRTTAEMLLKRKRLSFEDVRNVYAQAHS